MGKRSLPLDENVEVVCCSVGATPVVVVVVIAPGGGGTLVIAFKIPFALAANDGDDPECDDNADGDRDLVVAAAVLVVTHVDVVPGAGGVRNVFPDLVDAGDVCKNSLIC